MTDLPDRFTQAESQHETARQWLLGHYHACENEIEKKMIQNIMLWIKWYSDAVENQKKSVHDLDAEIRRRTTLEESLKRIDKMLSIMENMNTGSCNDY